MPLPAPASIRVLEGTGAVFESTDETRELVTPTGAAILAGLKLALAPAGNPFTVKACAFIVAGHVAHHLAVLREKYF